MVRFWLIIGGLLSFINLVQAQSYDLNVWTPVVADSTQLFSDLSTSNKKWQLKLRSDSSKRWARIEVRRSFVDAKGITREKRYWVKYDINYAALQLKSQLKRLGLSRLPVDSAAILIKACCRHGQTIGYWLFIEGAHGFLWLSSFVKVEGSAIVKGRAKLYEQIEPLSLQSLVLDSLPEAWLLKSNNTTSLIAQDGQLLKLDQGDLNVVSFSIDSLMNRTTVQLIGQADTSWVVFSDDGLPVHCGWRLGSLVGDSIVNRQARADSNAQVCYFNGSALKILDVKNLSEYELPFLSSTSQPDFKVKTVSQTKILEVSDFGQPKAWVWPASKTITPVPDTIYNTKLGTELVVVAKEDNFLAVVDSNSQLIDYSLPDDYKLVAAKSKNLTSLINGQADEFQSQFDLDDDIVEVVYVDDHGRLDSSWLWPSQGFWSPDRGQPLYLSKDSLFIFRQGQNLVRVSKDWQSVLETYKLKTSDDKNLYGFRIKSILNFTVLEVDYHRQDQICSDWLWLKPDGQAFISSALGLLQGRADCDTNLYIFLQWSKLVLLSTTDWHIRAYPFDFYPQQPLAKLEDYSAVVYRDGYGQLMARVVCTKKSEGRWLYDKTAILSED